MQNPFRRIRLLVRCVVLVGSSCLALFACLPTAGAAGRQVNSDEAAALRVEQERLQWIHDWAGRPAPVFVEESARGVALEQKQRRLARLPNLLCFQSTVFDPVLQDEPDFSAFLPRRTRPRPTVEGRYQVIQFRGRILPFQRAELVAAGAEIVQYVPNNAFIVRADSVALDRVGGMDSVRWWGPVVPGFKVEQRLMRAAAGLDTSRESEPRIRLMASFFPGEDRAGGVAEIRSSGLQVADVISDSRDATVVVEVTRTQLLHALRVLSAAEFVSWIEAEPRYLPTNDHSIWVGQSYDTVNGPSEVNSLEYPVSGTIWQRDILGSGQIVAVADSGIDRDACQFRDPTYCPTPAQWVPAPHPLTVFPQRKLIAYNVLPGAHAGDHDSSPPYGVYHGTHVAGTIVGDNLANRSDATHAAHDAGDGIAPQATVVFEDVGTPTSDYFLGIPYYIDLLWLQEESAGASISSNSWGSGCDSPPCGTYTNSSMRSDRFVWEHQEFLIFYSSGNSGGNSADGTTGHADKNVITVGATTHGGASDRANSLADFSSRGPALDGRYKPDITAPGVDVQSATGGEDPPRCSSPSCSMRRLQGTSMACPTAAGFATLVRQYYMEGWYPTGSRTPSHAFTPSAALVKASLINGAVNMTGTDVGGDAPNHDQGWGRIHLDNVLYFDDAYGTDTRKSRVWDIPLNSGLRTDEVDEYQIRIEAGQSLKVTLVWTDPAAAPYSGLALINNLDLEVVGPQGTYRGNVWIDPSPGTPNGDKQSTVNPIEKDDINNVEGVLLSAPSAGTYTLRVRGFDIPGNGDPASMRQGYALVATGGIDLTAGSITFDRRTYPCGSSSATVTLLEATTSPSTVTLGCAATGDSETLVVSGSQPLFSGTMPLEFNAPVVIGDGRLQVGDSTSITAEYSSEFTAIATAQVGGCGAAVVFEEAHFAAGCDSDQFLDAHETADLQVSLRNRETSSLSNLNAVLTTTTPGVVIGTDSVQFGDIVPGGAVTNATPFVVSALDVAAGTEASFELSLTADGFAEPTTVEFTTFLEQDVLRLVDQTVEFDFEGGADGDLSPPCQYGSGEYWTTGSPDGAVFSAIRSTCDSGAPSGPHLLAFSNSAYTTCGDAASACSPYPDEKRGWAASPWITTTPPGSVFLSAEPRELAYRVRASLPGGTSDDGFYVALRDSGGSVYFDEAEIRQGSPLNTDSWQAVAIDLSRVSFRDLAGMNRLQLRLYVYSSEQDDDNPSTATGTLLVDDVRLTYDAEGRVADNTSCSLPCSSPGAPAALVAVDEPGMVHLAWDFVSEAGEYHLFRSSSGCDGAFAPIGEVPGSRITYNDRAVQTGVTYSYRVRSVDPSGACESVDSECATVILGAGTCATPPSFSGVSDVVSQDEATCGVSVAFDPGVSHCGGTVTYDVFRSADAEFVPGPGNLVATGVTGSPWVDTKVATLTHYCYAVRAVDPAGNDDGNEQKLCVLASGPKTLGSFYDDAEVPGLLDLEQPWIRSAQQNHSSGGTQSYAVARADVYPALICGAATSPALELMPSGTTTLSFWSRHNVEYRYDGMVVEVGTARNAFLDWSPVPSTGFYPGDFSETADCAFGAFCPGTTYCNACCYPPGQGAFNGPEGNEILTYWTHSTIDLGGYNGEVIKFRFNFSSDPYTEHEGVFVDQIQLSNVARPSVCTSAPCNSGPEFYGIVSAADLDPDADSGVLLSWPEPENWGTGEPGNMLVHRDGAQIATLPPTATTYVDGAGQDGKFHAYHVSAINSCGLRDGNGIRRVAGDCAVSDVDVGASELNLRVVEGKVRLAWTPVSGSTTSSLHWVAAAALTASCDAGSVWDGDRVDLDRPSTTFEHDVCSDGQSYFYSISASSGDSCPEKRGVDCP